MPTGAPYGSTIDFGGVSGTKYTWNDGPRVIDMQPGLVSIDPDETPVCSRLDDRQIKSASPEWQVLTLDAPGENKQVEGRTYTFSDENVPVRRQNVTQIFDKTARVTGTSQAEVHFHTADMIRDQINIKTREINRDFEYAVVNSAGPNTLAEPTAREMRGLLASFTTNADSGSTFSETLLKETILYSIWNAGASPDVVVVPSGAQNIIDQFDGSFGGSSHRVTQDGTSMKRVSNVKQYDSPYGMVDVILERTIYLAADTVFAMDSSFFHKGWLRKLMMEETPKDGDYWSAVMTAEWTLIDDNEAAGAKETSLSYS